MPQTEDEVKDSLVSDSPAQITGWWRKFHFSGRVIMCSVLFGLGLVLIGGLIFAINMNDDTMKNDKTDSGDELPTKAPSNYVGPVIMGIGGFIVIVGVIMCLFETQVCRKKSGDAKPLISNMNEDMETKVSDSTSVPSSSHCHKNHKHKSRKASSSPRKTKGKHAKPYSHERKLASSKSPPVSIDKSKSFMTSSEDKFLTPPNTLNEHPALVHSNSKEAEIQTSSSLMKSFTSSGPSWNQSAEFLTPTASFNDNSISVDNSVELDEKQGQADFKTLEVPEMGYTRNEFMTPLTAEEEKIQNMFNQVKNEHIEASKVQSEEKESTENSSFDHGSDASVITTESANKNAENINISKNNLSLDINFDSPAVKEAEKPEEALLEKSKIINEANTLSDSSSIISNVPSEESTCNKNESVSRSSDVTAHTYKIKKEDNSKKDIPSLRESTGNIKSEGDIVTEEKEKLYVTDTKKLDPFFSCDSSTPHINEAKNIPKFESESSNDEKNNENNLEVDLESSASSEETLISRDSSIEKPKDNDAQRALSIAEEKSNDKSTTSDVSESLKDQSLSNDSISDHRNSLTDISKVEKVGASDLTENENDLKETKNTDEKLIEKSS